MRQVWLKTAIAISTALFACTTAFAENVTEILLFDTQGRPSVNAYVNGEGPFLFAIDTAGQRSMLGREIIDAVGLEPDPANKAQVHGAGGAAIVDMYPVDELRFAGLTRNDLLLIEPAHERESDALGLIGVDLFKGQRIEFDFSENTFSVESGDRPDGFDGYSSIPARSVYNVFTLIDISINGVAATALVDTGAISTMGNLALFEALGLSDENASITLNDRRIGVTGDVQTFRDGFSGDISMGGVSIQEATMTFAALPVFRQFGLAETPAIILGLDTLKRLDGIAIDYGASEFQFRKEN